MIARAPRNGGARFRFAMSSEARVAAMTHLRIRIAYAVAVLAVCVTSWTVWAADDPLASWNDGPAKRAILEFVHATTDPSSPTFVPPEARIAAFDQDGTLWVEHPHPPLALSAALRLSPRSTQPVTPMLVDEIRRFVPGSSSQTKPG
jgi:hypothetical protein